MPGDQAFVRVLAVARDRTIDEIGSFGAQGIEIDAEPTGHAGTKPLQEDAGSANETTHDLAALLGFQIDSDAAFAAVDRVEKCRYPPCWIATVQLLDDDYVGAEIGQ